MTPVLPPILNQTLADARLQETLYSNTARSIRKRSDAVHQPLDPGFERLRDHAHAIKLHTLENLDHYLQQVEAKVVEHGGKVVWARDANDAVEFVRRLARERGAGLLVKSKSMTTEEVHFNDRLGESGVEVVETDLGEYIVQLSAERPYHIVTPALHMNRYDVADLFEKKLHLPREEDPEQLTRIARGILRDKFLRADIGVTGGNFLVASSGAVVLVENEGNVRLSSSAPRIQVCVVGIEKVIPRMEDLGVFLKILGRSATGQDLTVYTSFLSGPRRANERDGPEEFHLVLLDNGRTRLLADREKRESLYCIRCGACLNHCPVYRKIGGHAYPGAYSGPIGAILTPQYAGVLEHPWLPFASSLCGACAEVCPVKIDIPRILLELRAETTEAKTAQNGRSVERLGFRVWSWFMRHPRLYAMAGVAAAGILPEGDANGFLERLPAFLKFGPAAAWASNRWLPRPAPASFRELWSKRKGGER